MRHGSRSIRDRELSFKSPTASSPLAGNGLVTGGLRKGSSPRWTRKGRGSGTEQAAESNSPRERWGPNAKEAFRSQGHPIVVERPFEVERKSLP